MVVLTGGDNAVGLSIDSQTNAVAVYVPASVYGITGYLRFFGFRISRDDVKDSVICPKIIE